MMSFKAYLVQLNELFQYQKLSIFFAMKKFIFYAFRYIDYQRTMKKV